MLFQHIQAPTQPQVWNRVNNAIGHVHVYVCIHVHVEDTAISAHTSTNAASSVEQGK